MTKVISLSDVAYQELYVAKHEGESFSDVVLRVLGEKKQRPLVEFFGSWKMTDKEATSLHNTIEKSRKAFKFREVKW